MSSPSSTPIFTPTSSTASPLAALPSPPQLQLPPPALSVISSPISGPIDPLPELPPTTVCFACWLQSHCRCYPCWFTTLPSHKRSAHLAAQSVRLAWHEWFSTHIPGYVIPAFPYGYVPAPPFVRVSEELGVYAFYQYLMDDVRGYTSASPIQQTWKRGALARRVTRFEEENRLSGEAVAQEVMYRIWRKQPWGTGWGRFSVPKDKEGKQVLVFEARGDVVKELNGVFEREAQMRLDEELERLSLDEEDRGLVDGWRGEKREEECEEVEERREEEKLKKEESEVGENEDEDRNDYFCGQMVVSSSMWKGNSACADRVGL